MVVAKLIDELVHCKHCPTSSIQMLSLFATTSIDKEPLGFTTGSIAKPTRLSVAYTVIVVPY